jgi:hypothetical protein
MSLLLRETWGPPLWKILHIFAARSGRTSNKILEDDEAHGWINFLRSLENIMPCALCVTHYKAFLKKHNINSLLVYRGLERKRWLTEFWFNLHNEVNLRSNKSVFSKDDLNIYEDSSSFTDAIELIKNVVKRGVEQGVLQMIVSKHALARIEILRRIYGL